MSTRKIHAGFKQQALDPEDPNWPIDPHTPYIHAHLATLSSSFRVLDIGSGKSRVSGTLKPDFKNGHFTGADFAALTNEAYMIAARNKIREIEAIVDSETEQYGIKE